MEDLRRRARAPLAPLRRAPTTTEVTELLARAEAPAGLRWRVLVPAVGLAAAAVVALVVLRPAPDVPWAASVVASAGLEASASRFDTGAHGRALLRLGDDEVGLGAQTTLFLYRGIFFLYRGNTGYVSLCVAGNCAITSHLVPTLVDAVALLLLLLAHGVNFAVCTQFTHPISVAWKNSSSTTLTASRWLSVVAITRRTQHRKSAGSGFSVV